MPIFDTDFPFVGANLWSFINITKRQIARWSIWCLGSQKKRCFFCALGPLWVLLKVSCSNIATCLGDHKECTICQWKSFGSWCVCMSQLFLSFLLCKLVASCFDLSFAPRRFSKTSLLHHYPCLFSYHAFVAWASTSLWIKLSVVKWGENCKCEKSVCFLRRFAMDQKSIDQRHHQLSNQSKCNWWVFRTFAKYTLEK